MDCCYCCALQGVKEGYGSVDSDAGISIYMVNKKNEKKILQKKKLCQIKGPIYLNITYYLVKVW